MSIVGGVRSQIVKVVKLFTYFGTRHFILCGDSSEIGTPDHNVAWN